MKKDNQLPFSATKLDLGCNSFPSFYLIKNNIIANNFTTTEVREKISTDLESLIFQYFNVR